MNHVDKDSRPDLLKGANVKVEPEQGGRDGSRVYYHVQQTLEKKKRDILSLWVWNWQVDIYKAHPFLHWPFIQAWTLSQTYGFRPTTIRVTIFVCQERPWPKLTVSVNLKGHSHFNLFINGCRKIELGKGLPFFWCADAVIRQFFHRYSVDAFRLPDPVVHLWESQNRN